MKFLTRFAREFHGPARRSAARARSGMRTGIPAGLLLAAATAGAQTATPAALAAAAHPVESPSFLPMALALLLVLGIFGAVMWALRRAGFAPRGASRQLRLVTQLALGPRERVVIVEAGERWWLLGVGSGGITRLGSLPKGAEPQATAAAGAPNMLPAAAFGALLEKLRGGAR